MTKNTILFSMLLASGFGYSQVGIQTPDPKVTLDITAKNPTGSFTNAEGLLLPRVDRQKAQFMTGVQTSTLVYVNNASTGTKTGTAANIDTIGYYYFNGSVWVKWNSTTTPDTNVYNVNGSITADRKVSHEDKTLAITGTVRNIFSIDGTTFSADAATHRIGIGTASPVNRLDLGTVLGSTVTNALGKKIAVYNKDNSFYGLGANNGILQFHAGSGNNDAPKMVLNSSKFLGIGTTAAASNLHVAGSVRISDGTEAEDKVLTTDANGVATWENLPDSYILKNFYNADGSLTANRTVTQGNFLLGFAGVVQQNAFSVAGDTFSVDAQSHRIGIGTSTPQNLLDMGSNVSTNTSEPESKKIAVSNTTAGTSFYGLGASTDKLLFHANSANDANPAMVLSKEGNLGIGNTDPASSSILDLTSTNKGFLPTRLTQAQRDALAPIVPGLMIYNRDINCMQYWTSTTWRNECDPGTVTLLNCNGATHNGTLTRNVAASNVSSVIPYTGGSGEYHSGQVVASTNFPELTATLAPGMLAFGSGTLTYRITGTPLSAGIAEFPINIGGQECILRRTIITVGMVGNLLCSSAQHVGILYAGTAYSGTAIYSDISYTVGNGGPYTALSIASTGVTGLTAKLAAGNVNNGSGSFRFIITGTANTTGIANFAVNIGGKQCTFTRNVTANPIPPVANFGCNSLFDPPNANGSQDISNGSSIYKTVNGLAVTATYSNVSRMTGHSGTGRLPTNCTDVISNYFIRPNSQSTSASMTVKFNRNVSNVNVAYGGSSAGSLRFVLKRNGAVVSGQLTHRGNFCNSYSVSGTTVNKALSNPYGVREGFEFNLGGVWFDEMEVTLIQSTISNSPATSSTFHFCVNAAQ